MIPRRTAALALTTALTLAAFVMPSAAGADASLQLSTNVLPVDRASTITVTGRGYLVPPHAAGTSVFGGAYVLFGWVRPGAGWGPSSRNATNSDGQYGITYTYPGEGGTGEVRDDGTGTSRFVAFTPGGIDAGSTPFHMDDAGNWSVPLTIAGPTFTWLNPATNQPVAVDCRVVQCGVFTIGAHGRPSITNERFVPVTFAANSPAPTAAPTVPPTAAPRVTAAPPRVGGVTTVPGAVVGGGNSSNNGGTLAPTVTTPDGQPATTLPTDTTLLPGETTTTIATSTTEPTPGADDRRSSSASSDGSTENASGAIHIAAADDGLAGWIWGLAAGTPIVAAASVVFIRLRRGRDAPLA